MLLLLIPPVLYVSLLLLVLYYLHQLKNNKECNIPDNETSVWDWRHNTLYVLTIYQLLFICSIPFIVFLLVKYKSVSINIVLIFILTYISFGSIYVYAFISYVSMNNKKNLDCLKRGTLNIVHRFLNTWRYILLVLFILSLVFTLYIVFSNIPDFKNMDLKLDFK